jgi:16S rRNA C1402 N4-methylase RsmH
MPGRPPLTDIAHRAWAPFLRPGAWAIDATAGNGHDTEFLARAVAPDGRVFAIDIQESAVKATGKRLEGAGLLDRVTLVREDHSRMRNVLACGIRARIDLICFNLGYLPHGNKAITTCLETTLPALHESLLLLNPAGALSVIAYRGHEGAQEEAEIVERFFNTLPPPWACILHEPTGSEDNPGPVLWMASGRAS